MNNGIDRHVEVVDQPADRPEFSDRGDSGVVVPLPADPKPSRRKKATAAATVAAMTDEELLADAGVEPIFSTSEAAEFFDRSNQWLYWGLREKVFTDASGAPILPDWVGEESGRGRRRFTIPIIRAIATSSYRRGNLTLEHLKTIMLRARYAELGVEWREQEGWRHVHLGRKRYRWVHPDQAVFDEQSGEWRMKPKASPDEAE